MFLSPCPSRHDHAYRIFRQGLSFKECASRNHRTSTSTATRSRARWSMQVFIFFHLIFIFLVFISKNQVCLSKQRNRSLLSWEASSRLWRARFLRTISCERKKRFQAERCNCLGIKKGHVCPRPFSCYRFFMFISHNHASTSTCDKQRWGEMRLDRHRQTER